MFDATFSLQSDCDTNYVYNNVDLTASYVWCSYRSESSILFEPVNQETFAQNSSNWRENICVKLHSNGWATKTSNHVTHVCWVLIMMPLKVLTNDMPGCEGVGMSVLHWRIPYLRRNTEGSYWRNASLREDTRTMTMLLLIAAKNTLYL